MDDLTTTVVLPVLGFVLGVVITLLLGRLRRGGTSGEAVAPTSSPSVWQEQLADVEAEAAVLRRAVHQREQRLTALRGTVDRLRAAVDERVDRRHVTALEQHLADTEVRVIELTMQVRDATAERDELRSRRNSHEVRVASLRREVTSLRERLDAAVDDTTDRGPARAPDRVSSSITLLPIDPSSGDERDDLDEVIDLREASGSGVPAGGQHDTGHDEAGGSAVGPVASAAAPDDLSRIEGVGPSIAAALRDAGHTTFVAVAEADEDELRDAVRRAGVRFAPSLGTWSQQAGLLARGDEDAFARLVDDLVAGRARA